MLRSQNAQKALFLFVAIVLHILGMWMDENHVVTRQMVAPMSTILPVFGAVMMAGIALIFALDQARANIDRACQYIELTS